MLLTCTYILVCYGGSGLVFWVGAWVWNMAFAALDVPGIETFVTIFWVQGLGACFL